MTPKKETCSIRPVVPVLLRTSRTDIEPNKIVNVPRKIQPVDQMASYRYSGNLIKLRIFLQSGQRVLVLHR